MDDEFADVEWEDATPTTMIIVGDDEESSVTTDQKAPTNTAKAKVSRKELRQAELIHKLHLLCYIAHGLQKDRESDDETLKARLLSLLPLELTCQPKESSEPLAYVQRLLSWFRTIVQVPCPSGGELGVCPLHEAVDRLCGGGPLTVSALAAAPLFTAVCRAVGLCARLVLRVYAAAVRPSRPAQGGPSTEGSPAAWSEVYAAGRWVCVDVCRGAVDRPADIDTVAADPLAYALAFDGGGARVAEVTWEYSRRRQRTAARRTRDLWWWRNTLAAWRRRPDRKRKRAEGGGSDCDSDSDNEPMPTAAAGFRGHPQYALESQLGKYEAIHPRQPVLGHFKGMAVFPRENVRTLRSADKWLQEGRQVRAGEAPAKRVHKRPAHSAKRRRVLPHDSVDDGTLPLYGEWQTEPYDPGVACNGKVPRNQYGNVYLFKKEMLPWGTAHLQLPKAAKAAKKLGIDYAPAMVGWEYHGGLPHPAIDGIVVCEEFAEVVAEAAMQESGLQAERQINKHKKAVLDRWKRLVRKLLISQYLKETYGEPGDEEEQNVQTETPCSAQVNSGGTLSSNGGSSEEPDCF